MTNAVRTRIVSAVEGGMPKAQAARTFSVSLSSLKRYVEKAPSRRIASPQEEARLEARLCSQARRQSHEALG